MFFILSKKLFLYWKYSMSHLISFSRYQTKCLIKLLYKQLMTPKKFQIFLGSTSKAIADREKKREGKNMKNWISWERKELFRWNFEKNFTNFWRAIICWSFKFPKLTHPSTFSRVLSISWSYRYTASTFFLLLKISVRLIRVSIILHSRQRDIPVFRYKLRMVSMWVICNSNILEQLKNKNNNPYIDWTMTL